MTGLRLHTNATSDTTRRWVVRLFGGFRLYHSSRSITHHLSPRARHLIAYLVLQRDGLASKPALAMQLWPDTTDGQARTNIRNLLHLMKRNVPEFHARITVSRHHIALSAGDDLDADVWRLAETAHRARACAGPIPPVLHAEAEDAALRLGEPLMPECYDDWIADGRRKMFALRHDLLDRLAAAAEAEGKVADVSRYARWQREVDLY